MRGFACIGLYNPKSAVNVGGAMRAASCYGAAMVAIQGGRFERSAADTTKAHRHIPLLRVDDLRTAVPYDCVPVAVEIGLPQSVSLVNFTHPERAFYVFGPEDSSLGHAVTSWCKHVVYVPTDYCMNLAATVNVLLYDRRAKQLS